MPSPDDPETDFKSEIEFLARVAEKVSRVDMDLGSVNPALAGALQRRLAGDTSFHDVDALAAQAIAKSKCGGEAPDTADIASQMEILDRLLEENPRRYTEEVKQGLRLKCKAAKKTAEKAVKPKKTESPGQDELF